MSAGVYLGAKAELAAASLVDADHVVVIDASAADARLVPWDEFAALFSAGTLTFKTITVSGQSDVVADSSSDTLTLVAGSNITITTDASTDTITVAAAGGSSLPVADTTAVVQGSSDATKQVRLEVDGLTTGTTRVMTVPDADGTIALQSYVSSSISTHAAASDPHGDRAYALALVDDLSGVSSASTARTNLGLGTAAVKATGTSGNTVPLLDGVNTWSGDQTFSSVVTVQTPTLTGHAATKGYVDTAVTGLLDFKGATDASGNPNYPAASKGDCYVVSVAGKIGGASGKSVDVGDVYLATADNAGGAEGTVGTSWTVLEHNLVGALLSANNLSDLASASTARTNLGLGTAALKATGTSGNTVPLLDGANTWATTQTFAAPIVLPDGSASAPGFGFTNNTNLGFYRSGSNQMRAVVNGTDVMMFTNSTVQMTALYVWCWGSSGVSSDDLQLGRAGAGLMRVAGNSSTAAAGIHTPSRSPSTLTADQNNYSPNVGLFQRWSSDASRTVTGMAAGLDGEVRHIWNVGANNIVLANESASSTAANRFLTATGADLTLTSNKCVLAVYDLNSTRWRVVLLP